MSTTFYLDESGHTGPNLLDHDQPVLVVASLRLEPDEADRLLQSHFPEEVAAGREVKHTNMGTKPKHQPKVLGLLKELAGRPDDLKIEVVSKRYALAGKLVDLVVEPAMRADGHDLFEGRQNVGLASMISAVLPVLVGHQVIDELLTAFYYFVHEGGRRRYFDLLKALNHREWKRGGHVRNIIRRAIRARGVRRLRLLSKNDFDLELSAAYKLLGLWAPDVTGPATLYFDRTAHMSRHPEFWNGLTNTTSGLGTYRYGGAAIGLSMQVTTHFDPAKQHAGLQLADIVAGATRAYFDALWDGGIEDDRYLTDLRPYISTLLEAGSITGTAPDINFHEDADEYDNSALLEEVSDYIGSQGLRPFEPGDR
jgi:hypothetical protein